MMDYIIHKINGNIHHHMKGGWVMRGGNTDGDEEQLDWNGFSVSFQFLSENRRLNWEIIIMMMGRCIIIS